MSNACPAPSTLAPSNPAARALIDARAKDIERVRIFRANVDIALVAPTAKRGDRHAFDDEERIALHQHPVGEGSAVALVGVANDIFLIGLGVRDRAPFDAGRKACAPAAPQAGGDDLVDDRVGTSPIARSSPFSPPCAR